MTRFPRKDGWYARVACAFGLLTRLPLPWAGRLDYTPAVLADSVVHYPLVGLLYGLAGLGAWAAGAALRLDDTITAFFILALPFALNRFLHFDGLCDTLDGFLADRSPEQRLAIMKDSRNGSFALGGAALLILLKFLLILNLVGMDNLAMLLLAPIFVRWLVVALAWRSVYPRPSGTGAAIVGKVRGRHLTLATLMMVACQSLALSAAFNAMGIRAPLIPDFIVPLAGMLAAALLMVWLRLTSQRKIGGVTGDVLGFLVETGETVALLGSVLALALARLAGLAA